MISARKEQGATVMVAVTVRSLLTIQYLTTLVFLMLSSALNCSGFQPDVCLEHFTQCTNETQFKKCKRTDFSPHTNVTLITSKTSGQTASFQCVDYNPTNALVLVPEFIWIKSNQTKGQLDIDYGQFDHIDEDDHKYFIKIGHYDKDYHAQWLTIKNLTPSDYGMYTCIVCTKYGRDYKSIELKPPKQEDEKPVVAIQRPVTDGKKRTTKSVQPTLNASQNQNQNQNNKSKTIALFVVGSLLVILVLLGIIYILRKRIFKTTFSSDPVYSGSQFLEIVDPSKRNSFSGSDVNRKLSSTASILSQQSSTSSTLPLIKNRRHSSTRLPNSGQLTYISELGDEEGDVFEMEAEESWEIPREHIVLQEIIGQGAFGKVMKATAYGLPGKPSQYVVAVKTLKDTANNQEIVDFITEIETMKNIGNHKNIINMIGTCTSEGPILLIVEHAVHGNLRDFLRKHRSPSSDTHYNNNSQKQDETLLTIGDLISFAYQSAKGMEYLASKKCIHRDLAARNVLVAEDYVIKIADFGLSRSLHETDYYRKTTNGRLPLMWLSLEALFDQKYTLMSDVWSFGVLLWEIFTLGSSPYPGIAAETIFTLLKSGYRMASPQNCLPEVYALMLRCWSEKVNDRPKMKDIAKELDSLLASSSSVDYLDIIAHSMDDLSPTNSEERAQAISTQETNV